MLRLTFVQMKIALLLFAVLPLLSAAGTMPVDLTAQALKQCQELKGAFQAKAKPLVAAQQATLSGEDKARYEAEIRSNIADYAPRFLALARQNPGTQAAAQAFAWIIERGNLVDEVMQGEALAILQADYIRRPDTDDAIRACGHLQRSERGRAFLRSVLDDNPDRHSQMLACWELAVNLNEDDTRTQAEALFERILSQYADVPTNKDYPELTMVKAAQSALYQIRCLEVGQLAPDIAGADVTGREFKLSEYRGKVVALVFWGRWCAPCWAGIPHERALAERLNNRPFALLGVNSDTKERCQAALKEGNITWPNWWDGGNPSGPISKHWVSRGWPTSYVFDAKGVIRYKDIFGTELDTAVDGLLKELEPAE